MKWFYIDESITDGERRQGPFELDEIRTFVNQGKIKEDTLIWHSGLEKWVAWKDCEQAKFEAQRDELLQTTINSILKEALESKRFAGFFVRALALFIDNLILTLVGIAVVFVMATLNFIDITIIQNAFNEYTNSPSSTEAINKLIEAPGLSVCFTIISIIQALYFIIFHAIFSATPGKKIFHIHVETLSGEKLTWISSIARYLCSILTQLTLMFYGLGYLIAIVDPKRRTIHDWIARTFVVYDKKES